MDGVYLLISGKVELIKESWEYEQIKMQKYASERFADVKTNPESEQKDDGDGEIRR